MKYIKEPFSKAMDLTPLHEERSLKWSGKTKEPTNGGLDAHPFHTHGRHFYDMGGGDGEYNTTANEERLKSRCPIQCDTSLLYQ